MTQEDPRILELRRVRAKALEGGGEVRIKKQKAKGKMTARERIDLLLDKGTFNEIEPFITHQGDELNLLTETYYGDGVVTGYGQISGRTVYLYSQDFTIYGGTLSEMQSHKICRVMDLAVRNGVPFISLIDSGGARIQEGVRSMGGYAEIFRRNAQYSGVIPQIAVMLGPEVIRAVTGEMIDAESLGGSDVHTSVSGVAHLSMKSEKDALDMVRNFLSYLP